jgi:sulfur transfer complex TusBCD TusB component (DsrH family)
LNDNLIERITLVDDLEFVELAARHQSVQSWF